MDVLTGAVSLVRVSLFAGADSLVRVVVVDVLDFFSSSALLVVAGEVVLLPLVVV